MNQSGRNQPVSSTGHKSTIYLTATALSLVVALVVLELGSFLVVRYVIYPNDRPAFFDPKPVEKSEFDRYRRDRDPELGWPSPASFDGGRHDRSGARVSPAFRNPGNECVVVFGDSYTYGDEVGDEDAWANVLASSLKCRVGNFGVGGYGTDQAFIRFQRHKNPSAKFAILGIFPDNVLRNVNQFRYFLTGGSALGLKPRFVLEAGRLRRIDLPALNYEEYLKSFRQASDFYPYETFVPGTPFGPVPLEFPFTLAVSRYATSYRVVNWIQDRPSWSEFVSPDHPSKSMEVTVLIAQNFVEAAALRGQQGFVLLYPTASSYERYLETGKVAYQQLIDSLAASKVRVLDLHEPIRLALEEESLCSILTRKKSCTGHFNPRGNRIVARAVYDRLAELGGRHRKD